MAEFAVMLKFPYGDERSLTWRPTVTATLCLGLSLYAYCPALIIFIQYCIKLIDLVICNFCFSFMFAMLSINTYIYLFSILCFSVHMYNI